MKTLTSRVLQGLATVGVAGAAISFAAVGADDDVPVDVADLPTAVLRTIEQHAGGGEVTEIERTGDGTIYDVEVHGANGVFEFVVGAGGEFLGMDLEDDASVDDDESSVDDDDSDEQRD